MIRFTYQHLLELVDGDHEFIVRLVEEGLIEQRDDVMSVDVDSVLLARTLWRNLEVDWPGIEIIVRLTARSARRKQFKPRFRRRLARCSRRSAVPLLSSAFRVHPG